MNTLTVPTTSYGFVLIICIILLDLIMIMMDSKKYNANCHVQKTDFIC